LRKNCGTPVPGLSACARRSQAAQSRDLREGALASFGRSHEHAEFTRERSAGRPNLLLNYGYAVLLFT